MASTTNLNMFEALFERRLKPRGAFAADLAAAGYDPAHPKGPYPTEVWTRCLEIARRHCWPNEDLQLAYRHLGREFAEGFLQTLTGSVLARAVPLMSPQSFVRRLATFLRLGRNDHELTFTVTTDEPQRIEATVHNPAGVPGGFVAGMIDAAFERQQQRWTIAVHQSSPTDYQLDIRWQ